MKEKKKKKLFFTFYKNEIKFQKQLLQQKKQIK